MSTGPHWSQFSPLPDVACWTLPDGRCHDEAFVDIELHCTPRLLHILKAEINLSNKKETCAKNCISYTWLALLIKPLWTLNYISASFLLEGLFENIKTNMFSLWHKLLLYWKLRLIMGIPYNSVLVQSISVSGRNT